MDCRAKRNSRPQWGESAGQKQTAGMERRQQAPEVLLRTVHRRSARRGIVFCDVQSSARRSARGAGNHRLRSEFLPQDIRRNFAIPLLPPSCGSPIFSACREPRPQDSVCFAGRASRPPPAPHPSAVRPFEPWRQQHQGSLQLRLRKFRIVVVSVAADRQSRQDRRCGWVGARLAANS